MRGGAEGGVLGQSPCLLSVVKYIIDCFLFFYEIRRNLVPSTIYPCISSGKAKVLLPAIQQAPWERGSVCLR